VVPLVTKESKAGVTQYGYMFSKGFIPEEFMEPGNRARIEDTHPQTFEGFVSRLEELKDHNFMEGNSTSHNKRKFTHANMRDFAESSGLKNKEQVQVALIERLEEGSTLDERDPIRYAHNCEYHYEYPYPKTLSGALQLAKMPWNHRNDSLFWSTVAVGAFGSLVF
jgi:cytochrome oxidase assembly protein ShyY1